MSDEINILLEHYQNRRFDIAEELAASIIKRSPTNQFSWKVLGSILKQTGRLEESLVPCLKSVELMPQDPGAHNNLGNTFEALGRLEEAEASFRQALTLNADFSEAHNNLGVLLNRTGRLHEAEESLRQALTLNADFSEAHNNLGVLLNRTGRLHEAEESLRQAIAIKKNYAEAYCSLGDTLQELRRFGEGELAYRESIKLKPNFAQAHCNLGIIHQELGKLEEAEVCLKKAVELQPTHLKALLRLGILFFIKGDNDSALKYIKLAMEIDPKSREADLLLSCFRAKRDKNISGAKSNVSAKPGSISEFVDYPINLERAVESRLVSNLYEMRSRELDDTNDARFGEGRCSIDFSLFQDAHPIIKTLEEDLTKIMMEVTNSSIYISESFFNILGAGGGLTPHRHITKLDKIKELNLAQQKYSLVYYLSVGDQDCKEPGYLKFHDPEEKILPYEGMITIFPASRQHSVVYNGSKDRIIIGVNFYSL